MKGEINSVRYEAVNAMLLNEFLKEHRKVEEQEATIANSEGRTTAAQQQEIKASGRQPERAGLRNPKVSARLELRKLRPKPCSTISDAITSANFADKSQRNK